MIATIGGGISISLTLKDKEELEKKRELECIVRQGRNPKVVLHIIKKVTKSEFLEEPGFHIEAKPKEAGLEYRTQYDIYLSQERFKALTNPAEDPIVYGGHFSSRCVYYRVDISFFAV